MSGCLPRLWNVRHTGLDRYPPACVCTPRKLLSPRLGLAGFRIKAGMTEGGVLRAELARLLRRPPLPVCRLALWNVRHTGLDPVSSRRASARRKGHQPKDLGWLDSAQGRNDGGWGCGQGSWQRLLRLPSRPGLPPRLWNVRHKSAAVMFWLDASNGSAVAAAEGGSSVLRPCRVLHSNAPLKTKTIPHPSYRT